MSDRVMNTGIIEETLLGLMICYLPFLQAPFMSSTGELPNLSTIGLQLAIEITTGH